MSGSLELRHLRYFVALAEELHFTRAAERVFLTQPALSQQIKALEELVGLPLVERGRQVRLTDAGEALLLGARRTLDEAERTLREARRAALAPRLALGYIEYAFQSIASPLIHTLLGRLPQLRVERREITHDDIPAALERRLIDVGIGILPMDGPGLSSHLLMQGRWQLVLPATHSLAGRGVISLTALAGEPLLTFSRVMNPGLHSFMLGRFRRVGVEPNIVYETSQAEAGLSMVALGVGLWVAATYVIGEHLPASLVARDLAGFDPIPVGLAWRAGDTSAALQALLEAVLPPAQRLLAAEPA